MTSDSGILLTDMSDDDDFYTVYSDDRARSGQAAHGLSHDIRSLRLQHDHPSPPSMDSRGVAARTRSAAAASTTTDAAMEDMGVDSKTSIGQKDDDLLQFTKAMISEFKTPHSTNKAVDFASGTHTTNQGAFGLSDSVVNSNHFGYTTPRQVPGSIFTTAHKEKLEKAYDLNKKYKLFIASNDHSLLASQCLCTIRGGFAFCINQDCVLSHVESRLNILPSQAFIKRSPKQAFLEPSVNTSRFDFHLLDSWMNMSKTLAEWADLFQLAESAMDHVEDREITQNDIATQITRRSKALTFKSSKKRKPSTVPSIDTIDFKFVKPEAYEILNNDNLKQIIDNIEDALEKLSFFVKSFHDDHLSQTINTNISILSNEEKLANAHQLIGKKSSSMLSEFDTPTIWSTLALVGSKLASFSKDLDAKVIDSVKRIKPNDDINIVQVMEPQIHQLDGRIDVLKKSILDIGTALHQQIGIAVGNHQTPARGNLSGLGHNLNDEWRESIEKDVKMLKTLADNETIRFGSLGFKTLRECIDWLKTHSSNLDFGYLVDAHIVLEYLYRDIETGSSDFLQSQLLLAKNKLSNSHEGCIITSFERSIPRLFLKSGKIRLIKHDESYFDTMLKYDDWKTSETGYRDFLVEALKTYKSTHIQFLRSELSPSSTIYQLAYESVLFSVGWLEDLIRCIDETYEEYTETRLNPKKAWSITTRLARALLNDISKPRNSIRASLKTQNKKQMKRVSFYGSLKSLDRMLAISEIGLKNSPIVSNELVKVLAKNTNIAAIEQLQSEFKGLQQENDRLRSELAEVKSKAIEASKIANGANNKSDAAKNDVAALTKRVQKVEKP